jgi:hypothetical protein
MRALLDVNGRITVPEIDRGEIFWKESAHWMHIRGMHGISSTQAINES